MLSNLYSSFYFKKQMRGGGQTSSFRGVPLNEVIILGVLETEQFAVSHMFHVFEEHYQTCQILGRRFFYLVWQIFSSCAKASHVPLSSPTFIPRKHICQLSRIQH